MFGIKIIVSKVTKETDKGKQGEGSSSLVGTRANLIVLDTDSKSPDAT
jgi:hypothetical protein